MRAFVFSCILGAVLSAVALAAELPTVEQAIPASVNALGTPAMTDFHDGGVQIAVTTSSPEAQAHVLQGINHLNGGWEFEASRHFAAAMKLDPNCLLAHWGMVLSLLNPSPETLDSLAACTERLLELSIDSKASDLEKRYVFGLVKYLEGGPAAAGEMYRAVAEKYPNDIESVMLAALFSRGGFDEMGDATPDQERAEKLLLDLVERHPKNPAPLNTLLTIHAEAGDLQSDLEKARQLCGMMPDYAPYFHLLGHYEWRCGNHGRAVAAFGKATRMYQQWMLTNKVSVADCPDWVRAECYRIVAINSKGDAATALAAAQLLARRESPKGRGSSSGSRALMWEAKTLPARLKMCVSEKGNAAEAAKFLPSAKEVKSYSSSSVANWWVDGLRISFEVQRLIDAGTTEKAKDATAAFSQHIMMMDQQREAAMANGEMSQWLRSHKALRILEAEKLGALALAGPEHGRGAAFNWFSSAADLQGPSTMLYPPLLLHPMSLDLGNYHLEHGTPEDAIEDYQRALRLFPNDMAALRKLKQAASVAKNSALEAEADARIKALVE